MIRLESSKYIPLIKRHFPNQVALVIAIMQAESSGNPKAKNTFRSDYHDWADSQWNDFSKAKNKFFQAQPWRGSYGLMQCGAFALARDPKSGVRKYPVISDDVKCLFDPRVNIAVAKKIYKEMGWKAWGAYSGGHYKKYLPKAELDYEDYKTTTTQSSSGFIAPKAPDAKQLGLKEVKDHSKTFDKRQRAVKQVGVGGITTAGLVPFFSMFSNVSVWSSDHIVPAIIIGVCLTIALVFGIRFAYRWYKANPDKAKPIVKKILRIFASKVRAQASGNWDLWK